MHTRVRLLITALLSRQARMTLLTPICLPSTPSHEIFTRNFRLHRAKLLKTLWIFRSTQNPTPESERIGKIVMAVKPRLYHAYKATIWHS